MFQQETVDFSAENQILRKISFSVLSRLKFDDFTHFLSQKLSFQSKNFSVFDQKESSFWSKMERKFSAFQGKFGFWCFMAENLTTLPNLVPKSLISSDLK